jgi:hypothetical protein
MSVLSLAFANYQFHLRSTIIHAKETNFITLSLGIKMYVKHLLPISSIPTANCLTNLRLPRWPLPEHCTYPVFVRICCLGLAKRAWDLPISPLLLDTLLLVLLVFYLLRHFASGFTTIHAKAAKTLPWWI